MCDFSLEAVRSRPAKVGDKLTTHTFSAGNKDFVGQIKLLPGTELSFAGGSDNGLWLVVVQRDRYLDRLIRTGRHTHQGLKFYPARQSSANQQVVIRVIINVIPGLTDALILCGRQTEFWLFRPSLRFVPFIHFMPTFRFSPKDGLEAVSASSHLYIRNRRAGRVPILGIERSHFQQADVRIIWGVPPRLGWNTP